MGADSNVTLSEGNGSILEIDPEGKVIILNILSNKALTEFDLTFIPEKDETDLIIQLTEFSIQTSCCPLRSL